MNFPEPAAVVAMAMALILAVSLLAKWRQRPGSGQRRQGAAASDSGFSFQPDASRVLSISERRALTLLQQAVPGFLVLAQVPLTRFLRVAARRSQRDWMRHVGHISADLLVCDSASQVLAVIDVRSARSTGSSERRHDRMVSLLKAANITTLTWRDDALPSIADARAQLLPLLSAQSREASPTVRQPLAAPLSMLPVPEITEVLAEGDAMAFDAAMEPVPSALFDDFESPPARPRY